MRGVSPKKSQSIFALARAEITRLSGIFSLYDETSEISRLNQSGYLENASPELRSVINSAAEISGLTNGIFDITVGALWDYYQRLQAGRIPKEHEAFMLEQARGLVDYTRISVIDKSITLEKQTVITLNALAQGYITDQVTALLASKDVASGLVNIGEHKAFGEHKWSVGIQDPNNIMDVAAQIKLQNMGLATSAASGGYLGKDVSHIFGAPRHASASVLHTSAMIADGLATAFTLMGEDAVRRSAQQAGVNRVILISAGGEITDFSL